MKKNILIFGHGYATQFIDISNQYTQLFDKNKYEVTVAYLVGAPDESIRQQHLADHVVFVDSPKQSTRGLKLVAIKKMLELQRQKNFQIVVCHRYKPTYVMLWVAQFSPIPVLFSVMHELGTMNHIGRRLLIAALARKNTVFAGVSNAVRDNLRETIWRIPDERVITLYNMIDVDLTEPEFISRDTARESLNLSHNDFVFGNIGRLAKNKDQKSLISAFSLIKPYCPNAKLVIIGDGQLESSLKEQVQSLNLSKDVIFTGFVPQGYRFMKAFDVYISSSIQEAFGRVLLEAMLAKVPVIATRVNGVPEVLGDTGTLIEPANARQLADEMLALYKTSTLEREKLGLIGYEHTLENFSLQRFNEIFWDLPIIKDKDLS